MKRIISVLLAVVLIVGTFAVSAVAVFAAGEPTLSFNSTTTSAGKQVTLELSVENNPGIAALIVTPQFDSDNLTLTAVENGAIISDFTNSANQVWVNATDVNTNGIFAKYTFTVSNTAPYGDYQISLKVQECVNASKQTVNFVVNAGNITVSAVKPETEYTPIEDFVYTPKTGKKENTITIHQYKGTSDAIVIAPSYEIGGKIYVVKTVALVNPEEDYFVEDDDVRYGLKSISIPETVTSIGEMWLYDFTGLENVTVLGADTVIAEDAIAPEDNNADMVVYGYSDSTAQTFADNNDFDFVALDKKFDEYNGIIGANLTLGDRIGVNFFTSKSDFNDGAYNNPYIKYSVAGQEGVIELVDPVEDSVKGTVYKFALPKFAPQLLGDEISAELHAEFGGQDVVCGTKTYSAKEYCYSVINSSSVKNKLNTLAVDLLNFGAEAQLYKNYKTDTLVNADLGAKAAWATAERTVNSVFAKSGSGAVEIKGANLNIGESIAIQFYVKADSYEDLHFVVKNETKNKFYTYTAADLVADQGMMKLKFGKLSPAQMDNSVSITAYNSNDEAVSATVIYSVESYAQQFWATENMGPLVKAMIKYGDSSKSYIGEE